MTALSDPLAAVAPNLQAAVLLAAREVARTLALRLPSVTEIIERTGAGRSRAYELRDELLHRLPELQRPVGRPPSAPSPPLDAEVRAELSAEMLRYVIAHPGCISGAGERRRYDDGVRLFVLELRERHAEVALSELARALEIPADTIAEWLRAPSRAQATQPDTAPPTPSLAGARVESVLDAWRGWSGSFVDFCKHVREHLRIDFGRTTISRILHEHGVRPQRRRAGRSPDEKALRGLFETFFPGAQWVGDGSPIAATVWGERHLFNLELMVDAHTGAVVGIDLREYEDADAVGAAFDDGVQTTGEAPLALLLDNRPSNHCAEVHEAVGDTMLIAATKGRPQNKAHCEGGFGLFQQKAPEPVLSSRRPASIARELLALQAQTFFRVLNHKPREDRDGRSRAQLYDECEPTPEQIARARAALQERLRKQRLAAKTRRARLDPVLRRVLDDAFERLGLDDPEGNIRDAIAAHPHDAVIASIAIFEGKRKAATLPPGADGRYLLGIVRNITTEDEGIEIAEVLWRLRLQAHDRVLEELDEARRRAERHHPDDPLALLIDHIDRALVADRRLDRFFWLQAAAAIARAQPPERHDQLFRTAARRIHATHRVPHRDRLAATRFLAAKLRPLA